MLISQAAFDLIVKEEIGDRALYEKEYVHPDWPGGASGVTIGVGYDCGYCTPAQLKSDWADILPAPMIDALVGVAGVHGPPARSDAHALHGVVSVSYDQALQVFSNRDVPKWTNNVRSCLPNTDKLSPDSLGALVSLAFNRGCSFTLFGDRYTEMRAIKAHMDAQEFAKIPDELRSMKRLWPNSAGLRARRDHEAALFAKGLS